jgi:uncharacterized integral membrane protein
MPESRPSHSEHERTAETTPTTGSDGAPDASAPQPRGSTPAAITGIPPHESSAEHVRREAHRARLYAYLNVSIGLVVVVIALATANTRHVSVNWIAGSSSVSLVWLVIVSVLLGWLLGLITGSFLRWRTRVSSSHTAR